MDRKEIILSFYPLPLVGRLRYKYNNKIALPKILWRAFIFFIFYIKYKLECPKHKLNKKYPQTQ